MRFLPLSLLLLLPPSCTPPHPAPSPQNPAPTPPTLLSWRVASAHLEDIFSTIPHASIDDFRRDTPESERLRVNSANGEAGIAANNAYIYGEPSPQATDQILQRLALTDRDVLYDMGCGRGYFLMQALLSSPIRKAVGVELATSRVDIGKQAHRMLLDQGLLRGKVLELREQDMAQAGLDDATVVYMDSVFFSDELLATMARRMSRARGLRSVVMIMKGLPPNPWFELERTERMKMSWSPKFGSEVLFFKRTAEPGG